MGALLPNQNEPTKFAQIYFLGPNEQIDRRNEIFSELSRNLCRSIQEILYVHNPYVHIFDHASQYLNTNPANELSIVFFQHRITQTTDIRRYNQPTVNEVAALVVGTERDRMALNREIYIYKKNEDNENRLQIINDNQACYDALHYVLMFPYGSPGWAPHLYTKHTITEQPNLINTNQNRNQDNNNNEINDNQNQSIDILEQNIDDVIEIDSNDDDLNEMNNTYNEIIDQEEDEDEYLVDDHMTASSHQSRYVSCCEFYSSRLMRLSDDSDYFCYFGRLYQQYIVDNYLKIEHQKLKYLQFNQDKLRTDLYQGLVDALNGGDHDLTQTGRKLILPASFIGGPRYMLNLFQDAMAIVRKYGKPDLFVTITCNPSWPEILAELKPNQSPQDIPDIVSRIFRLKLKVILDQIINKGILGKVNAHMYVIEFQKRVYNLLLSLI
jgi:hypothetical protein